MNIFYLAAKAAVAFDMLDASDAQLLAEFYSLAEEDRPCASDAPMDVKVASMEWMKEGLFV